MISKNYGLNHLFLDIISRLDGVQKIVAATSVLIVFLSAVLSVYAPYQFSRAVDKFASGEKYYEIVFSLAFYVILMAASFTLIQISKYSGAIVSEAASLATNQNLLLVLSKKESKFFQERNASEIQSAQSQGVQAVESIIQLGLMYIIPTATQLTLTIFLLGSELSVLLAIVAGVYGAVYIALTRLSNKWSEPDLRCAIAATQNNAKFLGTVLPAIETMRYYRSTPWINSQFMDTSQAVYKSWEKYSKKRLTFCLLYGSAFALQFALAFWIVIEQYEQGLVTIGGMVLFNMLLLQLNAPFEMVGLTIDNFLRAFVRIQPYMEIWRYPEENDVNKEDVIRVTSGKIEFRNVSYKYEGGAGICGISFIADRDRVTFIKGSTGAGKSTIFKLALRTIHPSTGEIMVDGQNLCQYARDDWYQHVGVVTQDVVLLNDTLATNIVFGRSFDERRLERAARRASIFERIISMPHGFQTHVGERGMKLSGGERQRIAIARALYSDPCFLFLDEASSALDERTEEQIMSEIRSLVGEVTVVAITHRSSIISLEDNIFEIKS